MPIARFQMPDGRIARFEVPEGTSPEQAQAMMEAAMPSSNPPEKPAEEVGLLGSVARGTKQYLSQARTALAGPSAESALAGIKRGEEINKELPSAVDIEKVKDLWKQGNYGSSALEYVKQMPYALAEQAPQFASAGAGAALGRKLGAMVGLPGQIAGTGIGALAGQFLSSYLPQAGGNIERQAQEQQKRGEPINISGTAAYGAALPQAALDVVQQRMLLGNKVLGQALGLSEAQLAKKSAAELEKLAQEKWLPTLLKGTGMGAVAEIPTEIAQQALERAQAGLSITDEDAKLEYGDTALQVGQLSLVGAYTRRAEKKSAQSYLSAKEQAETAKTARDAAVARNIAEEAERNKPENLLALHDNYQTALTKMQELQLASKKPGKSATPEQIQAYQTAKAAAKAYKAETLDPLQEEYTQRSAQVAPLVAQRLSQQQQQQAAQQAADAAKQQADLKRQQDELNARMQRSEFAGPMVQQNIPGVETGTVTQPPELDLFGQPVKPREEEPTDNRARALEFAQKQQELARMLEAHQQQGSALAALGDTKGLKKLKPQRKLLENEYKYVTEQLELLGGYTDPVTERKKLVKELNTAQAQLKAMSGEGYDPVKADKLVDRIEALKAIVPFDAGAEDLVQKRIEGDFGFGKKALPANQEQTAGGNAWGVVYPQGRPKEQGPGTRAEATGAENEEQAYLAEQQAAADETVADVAEREERARQGKIRAAAEAETLRRIGQTPAKPLRAESGEPLPAMGQRPLIGSAAEAILQEAEAKEQQRIAEQEAQEDQKLQAKSPSAALGQMQQLLLGEDVTYTGEEDQPQKEAPPEITPRRVPRQDLLGGNKPFEQEAPTYDELARRLERLLLRDDLSDDARAFLLRAERVLPESDTSLLEETKGYNNLTATDVARSDSYHRLLDEQLRLIERGEEGIDPEALAQRPLFEQQRLLKSSFIGNTRVQQRITDAAPGDTIRGPKSLEEAYNRISQEELNARAAPLSLQDALEPLVRSQERIKDEGTGQMELPLTHEVAGKQVSIAQELGAVKPDAASFMRFMNSPHVRTLQKTLMDETRALENYAEKSPALKEQIASLVARLDQMDAAQEGLRTARDVLKANQDLVGVKRDVQSLRTAMTQMVLERMHVAGRIDGLLQQRAARQTAVDQMPISEADKTALLKQVDGVHAALQTAQIELNAVDSALKYLDAHIRVTTAQNNMAALVAAQPVAYRNAAVGPAPNTTTKMGAMREELLAAKAALSKLQKPVLAKQRAERAAAATATAAEKETQRKQAAITAGELEKQRTSYYEEHQRRLEAAHGQKFAGAKYEAISEAQRIAREMQEKGESKITVDENEQVKGDPERVLRGYQATITGLEKSIAKKQDRSRDFLIKGLEPLLKTYQGLQAQYEKLESSAQRKIIGEKLDVAREAYETAANKLIDTKLVWKGYAKDVADLATAYRKYQQLEGMISSRQVALKPTAETVKHLARQERERKTVLQSKEEKAAAAVEANKAAAEEAKTRAGAPETSGEPLERTQERKAKATQKTQYSGKGVGQDTTNPNATPATPKEKSGPVSLSKEQVAAVEGDKLVDALMSVAADTTKTTQINRVVAEHLAKLVQGVKVSVEDKITDAAGNKAFGSATISSVKLSRDGGLTQEILLHETTHAAVEHVLSLPDKELTKLQLTAKRELQALFAAVKKDPKITSQNAKTDLFEFVAEVMSNSELQAQLRGKKWTISDAWTRFKSAILSLLGIKNDNMLGASLQSVEALLAAPLPRAAKAKVTPRAPAAPEEQTVRYARAGVAAAGIDPMGGLLFRSNRITNATLSNLVAEQKPWYEKLRANFFGLGGRQNIVDMYASLDEALTRGMNANQITSLEGTQAQYYLRYGEQRSQYVGQFVVNGPVSLKAKKTAQGTEYTFQSTPGATLHKVAELAGQAKLGNDATTEAYFTAYIAGKRAMSPGVGWDKLNTDPTVARQAYAEVMQKLDADPAAKTAFEAAEKEYKEYNNGLIDFNVQTGALSKAKGDQLKSMTYIPYYRVVNDNVELYIDSENIVKIGNIKNQPQLKELVGGNQKILPIFTSAMQNTAMLTDMAMRNIRTKNTAYALFKLGAVSRISDGDGPAGSNIVRFREDGKKKYAVVDTDTFGIPAELFVKSMEGIATSIPAVFRIMGMPADFLRKVVTRLPTYAFRQVIRDPMAAWMTTGTSGVPILSSFRELSKMMAGRSETEGKLMAAGAISSNVFTGDVRDMDKLLRGLRSGRSGWEKFMAQADALAIQADSSTRAVIYNDSLNKGMTEMEALMRTLESMNFGRRGLSPSMQVLSMIIPFFNSQVQGLDVVYRTARGKMIFNDRLDLQSKLFSRGMLLAATAVMYAAYMQDDDAYKKATPEERYGNFFVRIPGVDEAVRVPIPFELGFIFKAIPEAIYNTAFGDEKAKHALKGLGKLLLQSNPFGLPQAIKPAVEVKLGSSFYGPDIESQREKKELATERFRENTSEVAKAIGSVTGNINLSPIEVEYLIRGYTGNLGVAMLQVLNPLLRAPGAEVNKPSQPLSKNPVIGSMFQPNEGRDLVNQAYEVMSEVQQTHGTFEKLKLGGDKEKVEQFVREHETEIGMNAISGKIHQQLGDLAKKIRIVTASPNLTTSQKDVLIKQLKEAEDKISGAFLAASEQASRTRRLEARP